MKATTQTNVRKAVACPVCNAEAGEACKGVQRVNGTRRARVSCHADRWALARARASLSVTSSVSPAT
jgi:hypothetical protein